MEVFGKYELRDRIAVGGMAEILLAQSDSLGGMNRTCVIKRILPTFSEDLQFVSMFIDEARITISLDHPNIVRLFDFGQVEGTYFMAMEYVDGTDLAAVMRHYFTHDDALPIRAAAFLAEKVARGLHHAHQKSDHNQNSLSIVHRDVSPQNVLLSSRGEVKVTDFGIAAAKHKLTQTNPGTVLGKSAYMSPEQALGEPIDCRTDIWALGVILYEMLTGERLFAAETPVAAVSKVMQEPIRPPSFVRRGVEGDLDAIVLRALTRQLDGRFASAEEMADSLAEALQKLGGFGEADLRKLLSDIEWTDDTARMRPAVTRALAPESQISPDGPTRMRPQHMSDKKVREGYEKLKAEPNLWHLATLGDRYSELGAPADALAAYRVAAALFANKGLYVQAICAYDGARQHLSEHEAETDLEALATMGAQDISLVEEWIGERGGDAFYQTLREQHPKDFGRVTMERQPTPLLGYLGPKEFARVAITAKVLRPPVGALVLKEGARGESLFAVGSGRLVVHTEPSAEVDALMDADPADLSPRSGEEHYVNRKRKGRVYLSALADGDFFGEFSFLTERPRSASVEAITPCRILELDHLVVDDILDADPDFTEPLLRFYKERVVELMMAKSPVFCLLRTEDRRSLLQESPLVDFQDEELVVREGEINDALYFIKNGEVEVFRNDASGDIFINKLRQGQFFGEIAAVKQTPRTVSVRAMGDVALFRIPAAKLRALLDVEPRLRALFERTIEERTLETKARLEEHQRIFDGGI